VFSLVKVCFFKETNLKIILWTWHLSLFINQFTNGYYNFISYSSTTIINLAF